MKYSLIKNYQGDKELRHSFNQLALENFGIDFEEWYQKKFWNHNYIPYSYTHNNRIVSNASANLMNLRLANVALKAIQIGTVSTSAEYRKQGLAKALIEEIEQDFKELVDFYYLFANDSATEFYEKCGYRKIIEKNYHLNINHVKMEALMDINKSNVRKLDLENDDDCRLLEELLLTRDYQSQGFGVKDDRALLHFYILFGFGENLYLDEDKQLIVIVACDDGVLTLHDIIYKETVVLETLISLVGQIYVDYLETNPMSIKEKLNKLNRFDIDFKPVMGDENLIEVSDRFEENSTTFVKENTKLDLREVRFPGLSHA